jgi:hypothetical protein
MYKKIADELYSDETIDSEGSQEVSESSNDDIEKGGDD